MYIVYITEDDDVIYRVGQLKGHIHLYMYTCIWHVKHERWNYKPVEVIKELVKRKIGFRHTMYQQLQCIMNLKPIITYFFYIIISTCISVFF